MLALTSFIPCGALGRINYSIQQSTIINQTAASSTSSAPAGLWSLRSPSSATSTSDERIFKFSPKANPVSDPFLFRSSSTDNNQMSLGHFSWSTNFLQLVLWVAMKRRRPPPECREDWVDPPMNILFWVIPKLSRLIPYLGSPFLCTNLYPFAIFCRSPLCSANLSQWSFARHIVPFAPRPINHS